MCEYFFGERKASFVAHIALPAPHLIQDLTVIGRIANHDHIFVIFCRRAQHRRTADVDIFNRIFKRALIFCDGLLEGIEVDYHHIDGGYAVRGQRLHVRSEISASKNAAVYSGVQGLDTSIEHFGEARVIRYLGHFKAILGQHTGGTSRR